MRPNLSPTDLDAQDNCSAVSWELSIDTVGTPSTGVYQLDVIHTAVDACGNAASTPQTVAVSDTTPPAFVSVPEDLTLSCEDVIPLKWLWPLTTARLSLWRLLTIWPLKWRRGSIC